MDFFNKTDWTEGDIHFLIENEVEESIHIEFKGAGALYNNEHKKVEIAQDVSAFANSDGGFIFYGIDEKQHKADSIDFIDGNVFTKEWLELVISSQISKRVEVIIFPVRFGGDIAKSVYVIKIPLSYSAPHQVNKNKLFYKRYNFQAVPMAEYEIRQCYERKENVKLVIGDIVIKNISENILNHDYSMSLEFNINIKNVSNVMTSKFKMSCTFDHIYNYSISCNNLNFVLTKFEKFTVLTKINTHKIDLFQEEEIHYFDFQLTINKQDVFEENHKFKLQLYTPNEIVTELIDFTSFIKSQIEKGNQKFT
jgi:hypothetical protein